MRCACSSVPSSCARHASSSASRSTARCGDALGAAVPQVALERQAQLQRALEARVRVALERARRDGPQRRGHAVRQGSHVHQDAGDHLAQVLAAVRRMPAQDLVQDAAQEIHVGLLADARDVAAQHLGRHVGRRARDLFRVPRVRHDALVVARGDRDAPVGHVDLAQLADEHVLGLEVAVDEAPRVREVHRVADPRHHVQVPLQQVRRPEALLHRGRVVHELAPLHAVDALQHDERLARVRRRDVVDRDDVGVLELADDPRLLQQPRDGRGRARLGAHLLDRHLAAQRLLLGQVHHAHAALAQQRLEAHP
jgi:hypothetical protein